MATDNTGRGNSEREALRLLGIVLLRIRSLSTCPMPGDTPEQNLKRIYTLSNAVHNLPRLLAEGKSEGHGLFDIEMADGMEAIGVAGAHPSILTHQPPDPSS